MRAADVAFAEVSEDNANVFLELGFALALSVPTVIVCDRAKRQKLPFDIAHRPVTFYATDAQSDYERISRDTEAAVSAALLESGAHKVNKSLLEHRGLEVDDIKNACLIALLDQSLRSPIGSSLWEIKKDVASAGISERMVALAVVSLVDDKLVSPVQLTTDEGEPYTQYTLSNAGTKYLLRSYSALMQQERDRLRPQPPALRKGGFADDLDDDVPF